MVRWVQAIKDRFHGKAPKGAKRSSKWREVRREHLKANPACEICGLKIKIEVHHVIPFHLAPDLELDPGNLMTLCENKKYGINCHLLIGHVGNYRNINASVRVDAATWKFKLNQFEKNSSR